MTSGSLRSYWQHVHIFNKEEEEPGVSYTELEFAGYWKVGFSFSLKTFLICFGGKSSVERHSLHVQLLKWRRVAFRQVRLSLQRRLQWEVLLV